MQGDGLAAEVDPRLAPLDLTLPAGRRLEPHRGPLGRLLDPPERADEAFDRLVAPPVLALPAQLLEEDARRVLHRRRPLPEILPVFREQGVTTLRSAVRLPARLAQDRAHGLTVQIQPPGDRRLGLPLHMEQPVNLPPCLLTH